MRWMDVFGRCVAMTALAVALVASGGCGKSGSAPTTSIPSESGPEEAKSGPNGPVQLTADPNPGVSPARSKVNLFPEVLIRTSLGEIKLRLNAEKASATVDNFLAEYATKGFYEGTVFHYVDRTSMAVAGGYTAELQPKPTRTPVRNEAHNGLSNVRGTIAMIRHPDAAHTATSQFYFNLADNPHLDHKSRESSEEYGYCVFGEVVSGLDVLERIAAAPVHDTAEFPKTPTTPIVIQSVVRLN